MSGNICQLVDDYFSIILIEITGRLGSWLAWLGRFGEQIHWPNVVEQIVNYLEWICEKFQAATDFMPASLAGCMKFGCGWLGCRPLAGCVFALAPAN